MTLTGQQFDWRALAFDDDGPGASHNTVRLWHVGIVTLLLFAAVMARLATLELQDGEELRAEAARPLRREFREPALRGRILAADGTVLARDEPTIALAMHYRWLENPPNPRWLRTQVRGRLTRAQRRDAQLVAKETTGFVAERQEMHERLSQLCGIDHATLAERMRSVQRRVERVSQHANAAHNTPGESPGASERIIVAEELDYHTVYVGIDLEAIADVEGHPKRWPGVRIVQQSRRAYADRGLAAHVLGHLGAVGAADIAADIEHYAAGDRAGRMGVERQYESVLRGNPGLVIDETDRSGRLLSRHHEHEAQAGRDVVLSIDTRLQRTAETLAAEAVRRLRRHEGGADSASSGAAIVVLDVEHGHVYCAASAPTFDPNILSGGETAAIKAMLGDSARPLFDRVTKMAIPPGSTFKAVTAAALIEENAVDLREPFYCQGYLHEPDRLRCMLFRHRGVGHGPTMLADALAWSCNVYFFRHAEALGPQRLADWAARFGLGQTTGIDLPDEASGRVPDIAALATSKDKWKLADTQALAIGQSMLQTTPLQMTRVMAAIANGGRLVTPRVVSRIGSIDMSAENETMTSESPNVDIALSARALDELRSGLERVVADDEGTGHRTVHLDSVRIAGKTGTAETGVGRADHAWFVGYAPADRPRVAIGVVVEHAGSGADVAGPIARRMVAKLDELGYFRRTTSTAAMMQDVEPNGASR